MSAFYCDSSALVKRYLTETDTSWVLSLVDPLAANTVIVAYGHTGEDAAAIAPCYHV